MKKRAFMSIVNAVKGFVKTISGIPPITLPDCVDDESLIGYSISGNSVQNGEPTPENPVEVESVGDYDEETGKYKISVLCGNKATSFYLDEPLRKIGNYADYIDFENQKVMRRICNEHITKVTGASSLSGTYKIFLSDLSNKPFVTGPNGSYTGYAMSNKFISYPGAYGTLVKFPKRIMSYLTSKNEPKAAYTFDKTITTIQQAQSAIGDGFEICYVLNEPIETPITLPKLPTVKGTTIYSIETSIQPTNMSATYYSTMKE